MTILGKKQMSEEDIKLNFITPVIQKGWKGHITMETKITDGRINIRGNIVARSKPKFADYLLYLNDGKPIAVVEAKDNNHSVSHGLQQAMTYAQMMDLPFAYSSNGDAFYEHDFLTGQEQQIELEKFPTQDELIARYYAELNGGKGISALEKKIVAQPYYSSQSTYPPRYYQRNAVNRTVEAIARGQQRLLLVMATGTGKTYTAFQIVYRLLRSDLKKRILYLADRNILVDQSILQDFAPLEKTIYKVDFSDKECLNKIASHEVNFALYHQMVGQNDEEHFRQIPAEYFDLIIVDECHRGSAKEDGNWRKVLEYFTSATQIGMTATPKESEKVSNIDYFGEPVYIYSLKQGIEDGFLAPFKVINITTNIGDGWRPYQGQTDIFGNVIEDRIYNNRDYDYTIILQDRIDEVAREITEYLKSTDRMQKTIVFCASEDHAERMRIALVNYNQDMVKETPDYCVRITGSTCKGVRNRFRAPYKFLINGRYTSFQRAHSRLGRACAHRKRSVFYYANRNAFPCRCPAGHHTERAETAGPLPDAAGPYLLLFRLYRRHSPGVHLAGAPFRAAVSVQPGGGLGPYPQQNALFPAHLAAGGRHGRCAVCLHSDARPSACGRLFSAERHALYIYPHFGDAVGRRFCAQPQISARSPAAGRAHCLALFCHIPAGAAAGRLSGHSGAAVLYCAALHQRHH